MANEVQDIAQELASEAIDYSAEEGAKEITSSVEAVKQAALSVLQAASALQDQVNSAENLKELMQNGAGTNDQKVLELSLLLQKSDVTSKEQYEFLMERIFLLQNEVNAFLGQRVQMVYVYKSGNGEVELWSIDNTVEDLSLTKASASHGGYFSGRYQLSRKKLKALNAQQLLNETYNPDGLNLTYKEILLRKKYSKTVTKNPGGTFIILWNEGDGWHGVKVSSEGVLAEAYAGFYLNSVVFDPGGTDSDVRIFMTDSNLGAVAVDNASGFLQGDISVNGVEYGIKTKGASAMGYLRIVQEAYNIYQACSEDAPNLQQVLLDLKQTLKDEGNVHLAKELTSTLEPEIDDLINHYIKEKYSINLTK